MAIQGEQSSIILGTVGLSPIFSVPEAGIKISGRNNFLDIKGQSDSYVQVRGTDRVIVIF